MSKLPRRKKHRNSKLGCATCKRRRIKCSEDLPACSNCVKHRVHCEYLDYSPVQLEAFKAAKAAHTEREDLNSGEGQDALLQLRSDVSESPQLEVAPDFVVSPDVTQAFDNLLTTNESTIIYPVYSFDVAVAENDRGATRTGTPLPGARAGGVFRARTTALDFESGFHSATSIVVPLMQYGAAMLPRIRALYKAWLGFFILRAGKDPAMFLCLLNLTTNYIITNVLAEPGNWGVDGQQSTAAVARVRAALVVHLIKHYAQVIKYLRASLNDNSNPVLSASVSYILSLMAIYDPEATAHSTKCFRDGLLSVLTHTLRSTVYPALPPTTVKVHLQFMKNVSATVYLPQYLPQILHECERMLAQFGAVLARVTPALTGTRAADILRRDYLHLELFLHDAIHNYVPIVTSSLNDIQCQEKILFTMIRRWTTNHPLRMLPMNKASDPLEKVMSLFYRVVCKCISSVVPQLRFFFLRDLDSPLIVSSIQEGFESLLLADLNAPARLCITPELYRDIVEELKFLASYATRTTKFLSLRLQVLYCNMITSKFVQQMTQGYNIVEWRDSITDVAAARAHAAARMHLHEVQISAFCNTYIMPAHYPTFGTPPQDPEPASEAVDFMSLQANGLLALDAVPNLG